MLKEFREVKRFIGLKFGMGEPVTDGVYAIPTETSKGPAFMRMEFKNSEPNGKDNFELFWDEKLTMPWDKFPPAIVKQSKFATAYREVLKHI